MHFTCHGAGAEGGPLRAARERASAAFFGGLRYPSQRFNQTAAGIGATMLLLSAVGLVVPATFHYLARGHGAQELRLDTEIAVVLLATYLVSMIFTLRTHRQLYTGGAKPASPPRTRNIAAGRSGAPARTSATARCCASYSGRASAGRCRICSVTRCSRTFAATGPATASSCDGGTTA